MPCVSRFEEVDIARALRETGGIRSHAAAALGVSPSTIGRHIEASEYLQAVEKEIINVHIDEAENQLWNHVRNGHIAAVIFSLKTKGRERGWSERLDLSLSVGGDASVSLPPVATSYGEWLSQSIVTNQTLGRLRPDQELDISDAELLSDTENLERVEGQVSDLYQEVPS